MKIIRTVRADVGDDKTDGAESKADRWTGVNGYKRGIKELQGRQKPRHL